MDKRFTPSCRRGNSPSRTRSSKRSGPRGDSADSQFSILNFQSWSFDSAAAGVLRSSCSSGTDTAFSRIKITIGSNRSQNPRPNLEPRTPNAEHRTGALRAACGPCVRCSTFDVRGSTFNPLWRVMGAWWPPRSSKPSSRHFVSGGVFDPLPLRHLRYEGRGMRYEVTVSEPKRFPFHTSYLIPHTSTEGR